jgi:hypothetical protein
MKSKLTEAASLMAAKAGKQKNPNKGWGNLSPEERSENSRKAYQAKLAKQQARVEEALYAGMRLALEFIAKGEGWEDSKHHYEELLSIGLTGPKCTCSQHKIRQRFEQGPEVAP